MCTLPVPFSPLQSKLHPRERYALTHMHAHMHTYTPHPPTRTHRYTHTLTCTHTHIQYAVMNPSCGSCSVIGLLLNPQPAPLSVDQVKAKLLKVGLCACVQSSLLSVQWNQFKVVIVYGSAGLNQPPLGQMPAFPVAWPHTTFSAFSYF